MVPEAELQQTEDGLVVAGSGWFVLNARDARWSSRTGRQSISFTGKTEWEADTYFPMLGVNLAVLEPGEPNSVYHWETETEAFLVLSGEALLIVEGQERPLRQWDFVHCPPKTEHAIIGAGDGPCVVLAMSSRQNQAYGPYGEYVARRGRAQVRSEPSRDDTGRGSRRRGRALVQREASELSRRLASGWLDPRRAAASASCVAGSSETIAGTVYGTIIVMATLVAGAPAFRDDLWHLLAIVVVTTLVFWAAHIYAHGLAESLQLGRRLNGSELAQIAHRERAMGLAVVLPAAALVIGALGVIERFRRDLAGARARRRGAGGPGSALRAAGAPQRRRALRSSSG